MHNPKHFMYIVMNPLNNSMRRMSFLSLMLYLESEPKEIMHPFPYSCLSEEEVDREGKWLGQGQWPGDGSMDSPASFSFLALILLVCHAIALPKSGQELNLKAGS